MLGNFQLYVFYLYFEEKSLLVGKKNESMIPPNKRAHGSLLSEKEQEKRKGVQTAEPPDGGGKQCPGGGAGRMRLGILHKLG